MKISNVIFDLDGTLLDTYGDIRSCMTAALREVGQNTEEFSKRFRIGPPLEEAVREVLPNVDDVTIQTILSSFREKYDSSDYSQTLIYPGIETLLNHLSDSGKQLFIATNKRLVPTLRLVERFGWTRLFQEVVAFDLFPDRIRSKSEMLRYIMEKWNFSPQTAVMVGDTAGDISAGNEVGFQTIAVTWGYGTMESMKIQHPTQVMSNAAEMLGG